MTKRTVRSKTTRTKTLPYLRTARPGKQAEKAVDVPITPAEPTFTLAEFCRAFGGNYVSIPSNATPLDVAMDVIEDLQRIVFVAADVTHGTDETGLHDVLCTAWNRADAALEVLAKFRKPAAAERGAS